LVRDLALIEMGLSTLFEMASAKALMKSDQISQMLYLPAKDKSRLQNGFCSEATFRAAFAIVCPPAQ
jgi:hypothetical protein